MENPLKINVLPCSDNAEPGVFFSINPGYVRLKDRFKVGTEIDIKLQIKPRNVSGLLISVHGRKDFLVLEMIKGSIRLTVDNGKGPISTVYQPSHQFYFCDGQWHSIQAVKSKNVVSLSVDQVFTNPGIGNLKSISTDTSGILFLGGHKFINRARGLVTRTNFIGCVKNVEINNEKVEIVPAMKEGGVTIGSCPKQ